MASPAGGLDPAVTGAATGAGGWLTVLEMAGLAVAATFLFWGFSRLHRRVRAWLETLAPGDLAFLRFKGMDLVAPHTVVGAAVSLAGFLRLGAFLSTGYVTLVLMLWLSPATRSYSGQVLGWIVAPFLRMLHACIGYLPSLVFIAAVVVVTVYGLRLVRLVALAVERRTVAIDGFHPEWAMPTYRLVKLLILAFAAVVIFPSLPFAGLPAFKGVSVFVGVLVTLGSMGAMGNLVAGTMLTYMRSFKIGDRVRIGDSTGDVVERSLLVTRLKTIKNESVTIPNVTVLSNPIVNYSRYAARDGLILHTTVTIGYDTPWKTVRALLEDAARGTPGIRAVPAPFVLQTSLNDFHVTYELNAYTEDASRMAVILSDLNCSIQDRFAAAGVEIMSPMYAAMRDGNARTVPGTTHSPDKGRQ